MTWMNLRLLFVMVRSSSLFYRTSVVMDKRHPHSGLPLNALLCLLSLDGWYLCTGNVIRYMFCRALQLPPEAWLRLSTFNCSLTYLMIRPTGGISCRMVGDIGHLKYDETTFSGYYGFKWS